MAEAFCSHPNGTFLGTQSSSSQGTLYFQDYPGTGLHLPCESQECQAQGAPLCSRDYGGTSILTF